MALGLALLVLPASGLPPVQAAPTNRSATAPVPTRQAFPRPGPFNGFILQTNPASRPTNILPRPAATLNPPIPSPGARPPPPVPTRPGQARPTIQFLPATPGAAPVRVTPRVPAAQPGPGMDPLLNLMLQQPSIDIESPASALAEFDPPVIPAGGRSTYRIVITALNEVITVPPALPAPSALQVTPGGRGQAFAMLGNKLQPRTTINYRVTTTVPGNYTIPPFAVTVSGKQIQLPSARLQVVPRGAMPTPPTPKLIVKLPGGDIYVGQSIPIHVMITDPTGSAVRGLTRVEVTSEGWMTDTTFYRQRRDSVTVDGRSVPVLAQEMFITPLKAGEVPLLVQAQAILGLPTSGQTVQLPGYFPLVDADPVVVTVKRVPPEGELPGFTGAIGTFSLDQPRLATNQVRAGEPVTLTLAFKGQGNLARLIPPRLGDLWDWQTFEPTSDALPAQILQQRGYAAFHYTLIPLSDRITATPPVPFSYFDPAKRAYVDLTVPPVPIRVLPAPDGPGSLPPPGATAVAATGDAQDDPETRNLVMNGLSETPGIIVATLLPLQQRPWFVALQCLPAAAFGGLWLWDRRRRFLAEHPEIVRKRRARRSLRRHHRRLRQAASARDPGGFVRAAVNAMRVACAPHDAANPDALVCGDVLRTIPAAGRDGRHADVVRRLFGAADSIRFGGRALEGESLLELRPDVEQVLAELRARL
ncbi:MAG: BatD family protein [Verrucomicrobia bacterium]|nr:BatD family protein [Verrucomicrobiota bacterium]